MNKNWKKQIILACTFGSLIPLTASAAESEVIKPAIEESQVIYSSKVTTQSKEENQITAPNLNQIRIGKGMIYGTVNTVEIKPELSIELTQVPLLDSKEPLEFRVTTNYSDSISRYELSFYPDNSKAGKVPLFVVEGEKIKNEGQIQVANIDQITSEGPSVRYQLKVYNAKNQQDSTTNGYIEFQKKSVDEISTNKKQELLFQSKASLQKTTIPTNYNKVNIVGQNLINVEAVEINGDRYSLENNQTNFVAERLVSPGEHSLEVQTIFKDQTSRQDQLFVLAPEKYHSGVGVADFTIGRNSVGQTEVVEEVDGRVYKTGRLAYYGQSRFNADTRAVLQVDTGVQHWDSLFDDFFKTKKDDPYQRLRKDDYYPTYGDDSIISQENGILQQGKLYGSIDYKKSRLLWGTYRVDFKGTELAQVNRNFYGGLAEFKSDQTTSFGENQVQVTAYGAQSEVGHGRNEFIGTGGSLYFLKNGDLVKDSIQLVVEIRNPKTGLVEKKVSLYQGKDYKIDEYQGRIILTKPLSQFGGTSEQIIKDGVQDELEQYLVVNYDYHYSTSESLSNLNYGGRAQGWLGDHLALGATHIKEKRDGNNDFELNGVDGVLRYSDSTYIKGEYSKSKSAQTENHFFSDNGGIQFQNIQIGATKTTGEAYQITGNINLNDMAPNTFSSYGNELSFWYKEKDPGFSNGSNHLGEEQKYLGADLRIRPMENLSFLLGHHQSEVTNEIDQKSTKKEETILQGEYRLNPNFSLTTAISNIQETQNKEERSATLLAARVEYKKDDLTLYGIAQTVLEQENYDHNQIYTVGLAKEFLDNKVKVTGEYSVSDSGDDRLKARVDVKTSDKHSVYTQYDVSGIDSWSTNKVVFGNRYQANSKLSMYTENQFLSERDSKSNLQSYGVDYSIKDNHQLGFSYQEGTVNSKHGNYDRKAVSFSSSYTQPHFQVANKIEYRIDQGNGKDLNQFVTANSGTYKFSDSLRAIGTLNYSRTQDRTNNSLLEENTEFEVGFAYRPVNHNRFNWLGRYTYIQNEDYTGRILDTNSESRHVLATEANYKLNQKWTIGGKLGYKKETTTYAVSENRSVEIPNEVLFYGLRAEYQLAKQWEVLGEYRYLQDLSGSQTQQGALLGVYRSFGNNFKAGVGYNFSGINDDLREKTENKKGWFVNFIGKF